MQPSHEYLLPVCGVTFAHVLTYLTNPCAHSSNIKIAGQDIKTLEYSQVVKIPESEGLLVCHCSARLGEFRLTLWVLSILMYDQEFHNKKWLFSLSFSYHVAANKEHICMTKNIFVHTTRNIMLCMPKNFNFLKKF